MTQKANLRVRFGVLACISFVGLGWLISNSLRPIQSKKDTNRENLQRAAVKEGSGMAKDPITPEEILNMLRKAKARGMYMRGELPLEGPKAQRLADVLYQNLIDERTQRALNNAIADEYSALGSQSLLLKREQNGWDKKRDRLLATHLEGREWGALFFGELQCPHPEPYQPEDDINLAIERDRQRFQSAIPDFPMLGRNWDSYTDVWYRPEEITSLRDECLEVQSSAKDPRSLNAVGKLISACDEALKSKLGLLLASE